MSATIAARVREKQQQLTSQIDALEKELADLREKESLLRDILGQPAARRRRKHVYRPKKTGKTIPEEIAAVVQESGGALTTRQIKDALAAKGVGAAEATIDSSVNRLKSQGILEAKKHSGRGNAYAIGDLSKLEPRKKPGRKPGSKSKKKKRAKKKPAGKKKAPARKKAKKG